MVSVCDDDYDSRVCASVNHFCNHLYHHHLSSWVFSDEWTTYDASLYENHPVLSIYLLRYILLKIKLNDGNLYSVVTQMKCVNTNKNIIYNVLNMSIKIPPMSNK